MAALAVITVCFNNIALTMTFQRDSGILKRINGTPLSSAVFLGARILHAVLVSVLLVVITAAFGHFFYNAGIPSGIALVQTTWSLAVGAAAFCALGFAISGAIPNADAALPIVNAVILPLLFLSGVFIPLERSAGVDGLGRPCLSRQPLPHRYAGRVPRRVVQLGGRARPPGLGTRRRPRRHTLLPLGTANRLTLGARGRR